MIPVPLRFWVPWASIRVGERVLESAGQHVRPWDYGAAGSTPVKAQLLRRSARSTAPRSARPRGPARPGAGPGRTARARLGVRRLPHGNRRNRRAHAAAAAARRPGPPGGRRRRGCGPRPSAMRPGTRVGVAWIYAACGRCGFCTTGRENLCPEFRATGRDVERRLRRIHGRARGLRLSAARRASRTPRRLPCSAPAPSAIGRCAWPISPTAAGSASPASAPRRIWCCKLVRQRDPDAEVYVFARSEAEREFARDRWAPCGPATPLDRAPVPLDAIIDTTPVWRPVVEALRNLAPGGRLVINAIRKEDGDRAALAAIDYASRSLDGAGDQERRQRHPPRRRRVPRCGRPDGRSGPRSRNTPSPTPAGRSWT